jgi:CelD/BcsL family acetyltransferase involved in cellulose biosynthesis
VRKAQNLVAIDPDPDLEEVLAVNDLTFARQGLRAPYSRDYVRAMEAACAPRGASLKLTAVDAAGRIHAGLYLVWDAGAAHGLILAGDPELRQSGAGSLLMWEAIRRAAAVTRSFDFGGSMIESVETFFRNFGTRQVPYHQLTRMSRRFRLLSSARELVQGWGGRP